VEPKQQFGENLRRLRKAAALTQLELGLRCHMDMAEVSRLERGIRDPRLNTMLRLAAGLQVDVVDLLRDIRLPT
jgi:transcriptional regulator with XRE-family HTH domain